jgi:hypothetical protein
LLTSKKEALAANRLAAAWKQRRQGGGQGYDHPTKVVTRERDGHRVGCERQSTCLDKTLQEATCSPLYHGRFALTASGRRSKGSYVPSESEDIDLK